LREVLFKSVQLGTGMRAVTPTNELVSRWVTSQPMTPAAPAAAPAGGPGRAVHPHNPTPPARRELGPKSSLRGSANASQRAALHYKAKAVSVQSQSPPSLEALFSEALISARSGATSHLPPFP
jgi:hypothetical protein